MASNNLSYTGDPSSIKQHFPKFALQLHCCRYWWLKNWEHSELSFPYWRIYHNEQPGGYIEYNQETIALQPDHLYLIAPNTNYSSRLHNHSIPSDGHLLRGAQMASASLQQRNLLFSKGAIAHLYIHFTLGFPYDNISPNIFSFAINPEIETKINDLKKYLLAHSDSFDFKIFLTIHSIITEILSHIDLNNWEKPSKDPRIFQVMNYIEQHLSSDLSNKALAQMTFMATNAFTRLFKQETQKTPQHYIKQKRINKACLLLLHSDESIDNIAEKTGFSNRYHFSRIFHEQTGNTPAKYKKAFLNPGL